MGYAVDDWHDQYFQCDTWYDTKGTFLKEVTHREQTSYSLCLVQIDAHCAVANLACLSSTCIIQKCID